MDQLAPESQCPDEVTLRNYVLGTLALEAIESIDAHLDECELCQEKICNLALATDEVLESLRHPVDPIERECDAAIARVTRQLTRGSLPAEEDAGPATPSTLGEYELIHEIARGGMGIVYKARHRKLNRPVALKVMRGGQLATAEETQRFLQEATAAARLDHRHIVPIYEVGEANGQHFIAMAFVEGESLAQAVVGAPLPPRRAGELVRRVAEAVAYAHSQGVVHRDLKPSNVLLDSTGEPRVTDFGLAKCEETASALTHTGQVIGTPSFMPPEQAQGKVAQVGPAADIYSLGATLYCLLTGHPPFQAASTLSTLKQVVEQPPVPPQRINASVDRDLDTICMKCLEKRPDKRYASATALAEDLGRFLDGRPIHARRVGSTERLWRWCRRNPSVAGLAAAVLLTMLAGVAGIVWQWRIAMDNERKAQELARVERWERYRSNMAEAGIALQQQDVETARRAILSAPAEHRGWEWHYFAGQLDLSQTECQITSARPNSNLFAINPSRWQIALPRPDGSVLFWNPTEKPPFDVPHRAGKCYTTAKFSPDGKWLAASAEDYSIHLWNVETGQSERIFHGHTRDVMRLSFSPDGALLASCGEDIRVWETATGLCLFTEEGTGEILFLPNGKGLAVTDKNTVKFFPDVRARTSPIVFAGHTVRIDALAVSADGNWLATGSVHPENAIRIWDLAARKVTAVLTEHANFITALAFSPDGRRLASSSNDTTAAIWDVRSGRLLHRLAGHAGSVVGVAFNHDGSRLLTGSADGAARLWDSNTGMLVYVLRGHRSHIYNIGFSHDGSHIVTSDDNGSLRIWDARAAETAVLRGHSSFVYDVAFSPDGKQVASAAWDGTVQIWDVATVRPLRQLKHDMEYVTSVVFDPHGRRLLTVSRSDRLPGSNLTIWDATSGATLQTIHLKEGSSKDCRAVFHPSRDQIAVGTSRDTLRLFDPATGTAVAGLRGQETIQRGNNPNFGGANDLAFRPNGGQIASGDIDWNVRLWDPERQIGTAILDGHKSPVNRILYGHGGKLLASASDDRTVRVWNPETRQCLAELPHSAAIYGIAFSPDGTRLATGCADKTIRLWSLDTYQEVGVLRGHTAYVHAVAFSPDGRRLVSGSGDFTVRIWDSGRVGGGP